MVKIFSLVHTNLQACTFQTLPSQIPCDIMLAASKQYVHGLFHILSLESKFLVI